MDNMLKFDLPKNQSSIIKVIGVGGGGSNAVSHMYQLGIEGVDFIICNTDGQALESSSIPNKIQLGSKGLGAGSIPDVGREAATENIEDIKQLLEKNTKMLFVTAGMGGGTGTGAAPIIAQTAKDLGILTVGIVTIPFSFEGRKRKMQAEAGIEELRKTVDSLLIICNDKLREVHGNLKLSEAFQKADTILSVAAKGIAEIITVTGYINVDFEDVKTVMLNSGTAIMGSAQADGENRAIKAVEEALSSPLLNDNQIKGTSNILLYLASGDEELTMDEVTEITDYIQEEAGENAEIIWGNGIDKSLGDKISITLVATGFNGEGGILEQRPFHRKVHELRVGPKEENTKPQPRITEPINEITLISPELKKTEETKPEPEESKAIKTETKQPETIEFVFKRDDKVTTGEISKKTVVPDKTFEKIEKPEPARTNQKDYSLKFEQQEIEKKSQERIKKLKDLSIKLRSPQEIDQMEKTPAYIRRNVELNDVKPSDSSEVSRFTLNEGEDSNGSLKTDNPFLHDNVD
ncbi:MAG: cell division protein FtsZ [Bacteroidales bacterium]|nr:cell division protein FtsZ [Bacteroidales bacterium]